MMISLHRIRKVGAIFFEVVAILLIAFYSSPELLGQYQSSKSSQSFFQVDSGNPIVYDKASENLSYTHSLSKIQIVDQHNWDVAFGLPALNVSTSKALFVVAYLRNVFYVFVSINAP